MTDTQRKRDPRYTRTVGEKPDLGRRYVENGKVRIEWYEDGKRRSRTIGDNSAKTRKEADEELERLLGLTDDEPGLHEAEEGGDDIDEDDEELEDECFVPDFSWLLEEFRSRADGLMDVADDLAEAFEKGLVRLLDALRHSEVVDDAEECTPEPEVVVDAEIVEVDEDTDETAKAE